MRPLLQETTGADMNANLVATATPGEIDALEGAPMSFKLAARTLLRLRRGRIDMELPNRKTLRFEGETPGPSGHVQIKRWDVFRRVLSGGALGFAEGYIEGDWDTPDLAELLSAMSLNFDAMMPGLRGNFLTRSAHRLYHMLRRNSRRGARRNIHEHYDLGNDFYALWLDPSMTYSSALFEAPDLSLGDAQRAKYSALADQIGVKEDSHVLEIGAGWGGFAEYAAKERRAKVTGVTISPEQLEYARKRMFENQLADRVDIQLRDYRDVEGKFDGVASIEMFEAVGESYWSAYFEKIKDVLKPGGRAGLQIITIRDELFDHYRRHVDFIQRHVFPGGMLPSMTRLAEETAKAGLVWKDVKTFGQDYARTLDAWKERFLAVWPKVTEVDAKFDEQFRRLWHYYLAYCEAGFRTERINVAQVTVAA
ncbi:MAG: cyclopropane-fatty-acyl-phospholipid synthase family protein [Maricaulaceae bacterium]|jgi:cyclopropane-fatty-acyl-phospholipid synthase